MKNKNILQNSKYVQVFVYQFCVLCVFIIYLRVLEKDVE
jgi:hypothetical protein